jgi:hypothetical protein
MGITTGLSIEKPCYNSYPPVDEKDPPDYLRIETGHEWHSGSAVT